LVSANLFYLKIKWNLSKKTNRFIFYVLE
jgi:hypothetical protein